MDERTRFIARVFLGVSLSILLHVIVSVLTYEFSQWVEPQAAPRTMLVEWIEPSDIKKDQWTKSDQIVRKADLPKDMLDLNVKAKRRFLSEETQTVKEETRARASGMTENRSEKFQDNLALSPSQSASQAAATQAKQADAPSEQRESSKPRPAKIAATAKAPSKERLEEIVPNSIFNEGLGDISVRAKRDLSSGAEPRETTSNELAKNGSRELLLPSDPRMNRGISTTGEALPKDIQVGDFTALNTDRFVYYTYYARIEEQIRHRWVRYVKAAIFGGGDLREGQAEYVTNLEIILNREGDFLRAIIHDASGSRDIDAAPILAFREARRIPHPPREMIKDDGTIRLYYSFHVDQLPAVAHAKPAAHGTAAGSDTGAD